VSNRSSRLISRFAATTAAVAIGGTALVAVGAAPASAAGRDGKCDSGEFCLYYNSGNKGSVSDFTGSVADYGAKQPKCYEFKSKGAGKGLCVKNHAASVWNRTKKTVWVYYNSNYGGKSQAIKAGAKANLVAGLKNQNASHHVGPKPGNSCKGDGTETRVPKTILVYRTRLHRVDRVSLKYYVKNVLPREWVPSWKSESLKAGAMAVKSFAWWHTLHSTFRNSAGCFDVYDDTRSQVYIPGSATARTNAAVDATWNKRITRGGKIMKTQYCRDTTSCGGWVTGNWMSQIGSRDKANAGWGYARILKYYYRNIAIK
jgi:peptidoglycan hydrolase-like amidase